MSYKIIDNKINRTNITISTAQLTPRQRLYLVELIVVVFLQRYMLFNWCDYGKGELSYSHRSTSVGKSIA
jgi:hypothetical protein